MRVRTAREGRSSSVRQRQRRASSWCADSAASAARSASCWMQRARTTTSSSRTTLQRPSRRARTACPSSWPTAPALRSRRTARWATHALSSSPSATRQEQANAVAESIVLRYPKVQILMRARDDDHQDYLLKTYGLDSVVPTLPADSAVLALPFGGEVLQRLGYTNPEVSSLLEEMRRKIYSQDGNMIGRSVEDKALSDVFKRYDRDDSGEVDASELQDMLLSLGMKANDDEVIRLMSEADLDGSETITLDEFRRMVTNKLFDK
eukprot:UN0230